MMYSLRKMVEFLLKIHGIDPENLSDEDKERLYGFIDSIEISLSGLASHLLHIYDKYREYGK